MAVLFDKVLGGRFLDHGVKCTIYVGWINMAVQFEAVCGIKFMLF